MLLRVGRRRTIGRVEEHGRGGLELANARSSRTWVRAGRTGIGWDTTARYVIRVDALGWEDVLRIASTSGNRIGEEPNTSTRTSIHPDIQVNVFHPFGHRLMMK